MEIRHRDAGGRVAEHALAQDPRTRGGLTRGVEQRDGDDRDADDGPEDLHAGLLGGMSGERLEGASRVARIATRRQARALQKGLDDMASRVQGA
jgi:hypothetical protein